MFLVVVQVTPLTHRLQVLRPAVFRRVIEVCRRKHDGGASTISLTAVDVRTASFVRTSAAFPFAFASPASALKPNPAAELVPVGRIARTVFRSDRHCRTVVLVSPPLPSGHVGVSGARGCRFSPYCSSRLTIAIGRRTGVIRACVVVAIAAVSARICATVGAGYNRRITAAVAVLHGFASTVGESPRRLAMRWPIGSLRDFATLAAPILSDPLCVVAPSLKLKAWGGGLSRYPSTFANLFISRYRLRWTVAFPFSASDAQIHQPIR